MIFARAGDRFGNLAVEVVLPVVAEHEVLLMLLAEAQRVRDPSHDRSLGGLDHDPVLRILDGPADLGMHLLQVRTANLGWK